MKPIAVICLLLLAATTTRLHAQAAESTINVRFHVGADTVGMTEYPMPPEAATDKSLKTLVLRMNYNESAILNPKDAEVLNSGLCNIVSIDLVYTHDGNEELLEMLNKRRLFELYLISPDVFNRNMVDWRFIRQSGEGRNVRKLFHGYVIRYRMVAPYNPVTIDGMRADVARLAARPFDNDLFRILKRLPEVEQQAVVVDFTGSMSPYFTQVMAWFFLQQYQTPTAFVFFNDGDRKPDQRKTVGKTGGIYSFRTNNMDTLLHYALRTVDSGNGGDSPENDVEAILQGIKENPKVKTVVLIADNWADMRDYALIREVKKPVSIILCGTDRGINTQYLDLARVSGGSLHTIEEDIDNLTKINEGNEVKIGKDTYILQGGRFRKK